MQPLCALQYFFFFFLIYFAASFIVNFTYYTSLYLTADLLLKNEKLEVPSVVLGPRYGDENFCRFNASLRVLFSVADLSLIVERTCFHKFEATICDSYEIFSETVFSVEHLR